MRDRKDNCTMTVNGVVKELISQGLDRPTLITVEYQVNGTIYKVTESVKLKTETVKLGFLPISQKKKPVMGDTRVGSLAIISYNPQNPSEAFITHNTGYINI